MMRVPVLDLNGAAVGEAELDERVFGITPNKAVVHQAVVTQLANQRKGTHDTKTRGEVAGGGSKPWRQKGTGRARQGSTRAPHWRGGGVVFGPHPRDYTKKMPLKMRRLAMRSVLSAKLAEQALAVIRDFALEAPQTKLALAALERLGVSGGRTLIVLGGVDELAKRAVNNIPGARVVSVGGMCLLDVLNARHLFLSEDAIRSLNDTLTRELRARAPEDATDAESAEAVPAPAATEADALLAPEAPVAPAEEV